MDVQPQRPTLGPHRHCDVLVITVDPPRQGHPIAVIGKSSGDAVDGQVFVRNVGKSDRATSAELRRLSARLLSSGRSIDGITIRAEHSQIAVVDYPRTWLDDWFYAEEVRLLAPLNPPPTRPMTPAERRLSGLTDSVLADISKQADQARRIMAMSGSVTHEENRTEDEFREQVGTYLDECRTNLAESFEDLRQASAYGVNLEITNTTGTNYEQVLVGLHIEGDVYGYEDSGYFSSLAEYLPRPPRKWGPWTTNPLLKAMQTPDFSSLLPTIGPSLGAMAPRGQSPTITNGGSVDVTCLPVHLSPKSTTHLLSIWFVGDAPLGDSVRVTWTATATNIDGRLDGDFAIPVAPDAIDLSEEIQHSD